MALFKAEGGQLTTRNKDVFAWKASCTLREMSGRYMLEVTELDEFESCLAVKSHCALDPVVYCKGRAVISYCVHTVSSLVSLAHLVTVEFKWDRPWFRTVDSL